MCDCPELPLSEPAELWPPLVLSAVSSPPLAFPEPALLAPPLAASAVDVPCELLPPLAVFAVPVPPPLGVSTSTGAEPCCPAWLFPSLAALEIAAPLSTPVRSVVVASSAMSLRVTASEEASLELPRTLGCVPACALGPGTEMPTLASIEEAMSCAAPGRLPADASPAVEARVTATKAAEIRGRESAKGMKNLLGDAVWMLEDERTALATMATTSVSRESWSAVGSAAADSRSLATFA